MELAEQYVAAAGPEELKALRDAFDYFTEQTAQLRQAYQALRQRAEQIDVQLETANNELQRKVQELDEAYNLQRSILNSIPTAVVVTDLDGVVHTLNPSARKMWHIEAEQAVGMHFSSLMEPEHTLLAGVLAGRYRLDAVRREVQAAGSRTISSPNYATRRSLPTWARWLPGWRTRSANR